jgi:hypothetical protein
MNYCYQTIFMPLIKVNSNQFVGWWYMSFEWNNVTIHIMLNMVVMFIQVLLSKKKIGSYLETCSVVKCFIINNLISTHYLLYSQIFFNVIIPTYIFFKK